MTGRMDRKSRLDGPRWKPQWSGRTAERIWKPAQMSPEILKAMEQKGGAIKAETSFFVALTDQNTYVELPRSEVRQRIAKGALRMSQPIWHPTEQAWKPARSFPNLVPEPQRPTVSTPATAKAPAKAVVTVQPLPSTVPSKQASAVKVPTSRAERVPAKMPRTAGQMARPGLKEIDRYVKKSQASEKLYGILTVVGLLLIPLLNWLVLDLPVRHAIARSEFRDQVKVHAHFRYYVQVNGVVVNFGEISDKMSGAKLVDMMTVVANASRSIPLFGMSYHSVSVMKGGQDKYVFHGDAWKELSNSRGLPPMNRAFLIVNNLYLPNGKPAMGEQSDNLFVLQGQKQKCFNEFFTTMVKNKSSESSPGSGERKTEETKME